MRLHRWFIPLVLALLLGAQGAFAFALGKGNFRLTIDKPAVLVGSTEDITFTLAVVGTLTCKKGHGNTNYTYKFDLKGNSKTFADVWTMDCTVAGDVHSLGTLNGGPVVKKLADLGITSAGYYKFEAYNKAEGEVVAEATLHVVTGGFSEDAPNSGFDATVTPPVLVAPKGGSNTALYSSTAHVTLAMDPDATKASVAPGPQTLDVQPIEVTGIVKNCFATTACAVKAGTGATAPTLNICVREERPIEVAFHFIKDNATPAHTTPANLGDEDAYLAKLNEVWGRQACVKFTKKSAAWHTVTKDLGPEVFVSADAAKNEVPDITAFADGTAGWNVFFTWDIKTDMIAGDPDGYNNGTNCLIEPFGNNPELRLAHEGGHRCGLPDLYAVAEQPRVMYCASDNRGGKVLHSEAMTANP